MSLLTAEPAPMPLPANKFAPSESLSSATSDLGYCYSSADILQHILEVESSRHRLERYARELSQLAERSAQATRQAQQVSQRKGDLLATLSHEIRTSLNGILGMANLLRSRVDDTVNQGYVDVIRQAGEGLLRLVDDALDLAKMEAARFELIVADLNLRTTAEDALRIVQPLADSKGLQLACSCHADIPAVVQGDALRIRQILLNLLSNAIKFTETGSVRLEMECFGTPIDNKQQIRFTVVDQGIGISPEGQARLFQPFGQADSSIARHYGGTGLGLAICKSLVEIMGGSIGVDSCLGSGSSFWFTIQVGLSAAPSVQPLPLIEQPAPEKELQPLLSAPASYLPGDDRQSGGRPRILLVEDNLINQKVALLMLKKLGHTAVVAENGRKAVEAVAESPFDLIIMDCLMPEMDGYHAARAIRQGPNNGSLVPIVAMTANAFSHEREACLDSGMSDYLAKPIREAELRSMLDKWLNQPNRPGANQGSTPFFPLLQSTECLSKLSRQEQPRLVLNN